MSSNSVPRGPRDYRAASGLSRWPADLAALTADDPPDPPRGAGLFEVGGHDPDERFITNVRKIAGRDRPPRPAGSVLITASTGLLALLGAGCFYVSWWAQYLFIFAAKAQAVPRRSRPACWMRGW